MLVALLGGASACDLCDGVERADSAVVRLTEANADALLAAHELALVGFYASWCEVCKWFAPTYEKVAEALRGEVVLVSKVNVAAEPRLARRYGAHVNQAPVLVVVRRGLAIAHTGGRSLSELVELMREHQRPAVLDLGTDEDAVAQYLRAPPIRLARVLVRTPQRADDRTGAMSEIDRSAGVLRGEVAFARAGPLEGKRRDGTRASASAAAPLVHIHRVWADLDANSPREAVVVPYTGPIDAERVRAWAAWRAVPLGAELGMANVGTYLRRGHVAVLALGAELGATERAAFVRELEVIARAHAAEADAGRTLPIWWVHLSKRDAVHARLLERMSFGARERTQLALLNVSAPARFAQHTLRATLTRAHALAAATGPLLAAYAAERSWPDVRVLGTDVRDAAPPTALVLLAALVGVAAWRRRRRARAGETRAGERVSTRGGARGRGRAGRTGGGRTRAEAEADADAPPSASEPERLDGADAPSLAAGAGAGASVGLGGVSLAHPPDASREKVD
ncbi:hypothetical protein KFE25_007822 [Diacronema lutheri]|uniref:Thioredoxin domain-containing protein n=1 Tax=Diacronema lutheri TaxID=2081491 RepID=A0A8J5XRT5_DIALT|nr:hypothetical protein KFE25_007822 [Diacronema lutheri]